MMFETQVTKQTTSPSVFIPPDKKCLSQFEESKILVIGMSYKLAWVLQVIQEINQRSSQINFWQYIQNKDNFPNKISTTDYLILL